MGATIILQDIRWDEIREWEEGMELGMYVGYTNQPFKLERMEIINEIRSERRLYWVIGITQYNFVFKTGHIMRNFRMNKVWGSEPRISIRSGILGRIKSFIAQSEHLPGEWRNHLL